MKLPIKILPGNFGHSGFLVKKFSRKVLELIKNQSE